MKFLVIGHLCMDVIHPHEGGEIQSYGGIYYSVATLASLLGANDQVVPVFGVNKADYQPLLDHLARFPTVDTSGIFKMEEPTNRVHLFYKDANQRVECSKDIAPPISYTKIRRRLSADGILVNMISGNDVTLDTLDHIRMAVREHHIPIHFDYHSLTLGVKKNHERYRRPVEDWRRWAFMTDTVQLNEDEIGGLTVETMTEKETVGHLLTLSVKGVLVTRASNGATLYRSDKKHVVREDIPGEKVARPIDATGCGDVFGAAFLLRYVQSKNLLEATTYANSIAARKARLSGSAELKSIAEPAGA